MSIFGRGKSELSGSSLELWEYEGKGFDWRRRRKVPTCLARVQRKEDMLVDVVTF